MVDDQRVSGGGGLEMILYNRKRIQTFLPTIKKTNIFINISTVLTMAINLQ